MLLFGMECSKVLLHGDKAFWKVKIMRVSSIGEDFYFKSRKRNDFWKSEKVILTSGVMLLYISSAYAAQIQYEFYYDAQIPAIVGSEVFSHLIASSDKPFTLQPKVNIDKVRYEWGGCIYAGWCISSLEIISS